MKPKRPSIIRFWYTNGKAIYVATTEKCPWCHGPIRESYWVTLRWIEKDDRLACLDCDGYC